MSKVFLIKGPQEFYKELWLYYNQQGKKKKKLNKKIRLVKFVLQGF